MNTIKLLAVASGSLLALGIASAGFGQDRSSGYGPSPPTYRPPPSDMPDKAVLKVCKVAGEGVAVGDYWSFHTRPSGGKESVSLAAGPGPGGYCQIMGTYETGTVVDLYEFIARGYGIADIKVHPANARVSADLANGKVVVKLGQGVTEVTIVNIAVGPGWFEICKSGARDGEETRFSYGGINGPESHTVKGNSCTPAREVPAGEVVVTESAGGGPMIGGEVWPASRGRGVDPARRQIKAWIPANGTIETQTIITFKNREEPRKGY